MSLREEMWKYEQITGESAEHVPIIKLGAFLDGYEMGIKALEQTRWIPVSERLPEEMGTYMTTIDYGKHGLATGQRYYYGQGLWEDDCVIAWMPLPQPYNAESEVNADDD